MVRLLECALEPIMPCFPFFRETMLQSEDEADGGVRYTLPPGRVEEVQPVVAPSPPSWRCLRLPRFTPFFDVCRGGCSLPCFPRPSLRVESGLRVSGRPMVPSEPFWSAEEATVLRAAGVYSPLPIPVSEFCPVLGSCDRCLNQFDTLYQQMIIDGVPRTCPCGIPLPHEVILLQRFGRV